MANEIGRVRDFPLLGPRLLESCAVISHTGKVISHGNGQNGLIIVNDRGDSIAYIDRPARGGDYDLGILMAKGRKPSVLGG
jgi:hypothetical protein